MTDYSNQDITGLNLTGANLTGANFTNTNATNVNFTNAIITNATFKNTLITGATLTGITFSNLQKGQLLLRDANRTITAVNNLTSLTVIELRTIQPAISTRSLNVVSTVTVAVPNNSGQGYVVSITPTMNQVVCIFVTTNQNVVITTSGSNIRTLKSNGSVVQDVDNANVTLNYLKIGTVSYRLTVGNGDGVIAMIPVDFNIYKVNGAGLGDIITLNNRSADYILWASGQINSTTAVDNFGIDFSSQGKIDLDIYNIRYEVEINWNRLVSPTTSGFIYLGFNNGVYNRNYTTTNNGMTSWTNNIETNGILTVYNQRYNSHFLCGYTGIQGTGIQYRYRTNLEGEIKMQTRKTEQSTPDFITESRMLVNRFKSDAVVLFTQSGSSPYLIQLWTSTNSDTDPAHQQIQGSALWETTAGSLWTANTSQSMSGGIYQLLFRFSSLAGVGTNREFNVNYRIFRVKKTINI